MSAVITIPMIDNSDDDGDCDDQDDDFDGERSSLMTL